MDTIQCVADPPVSQDELPNEQAVADMVLSIHPSGKLKTISTIKDFVHCITVQTPSGSSEKIILRIHGPHQSPNFTIQNELKVLTYLQSMNLPFATPFPFQINSHIFSRPCLAVRYIPGTSLDSEALKMEPQPQIQEMATKLFLIHSIDLPDFPLPSFEKEITEKLSRVIPAPDNSLQEERIRNFLKKNWPFKYRNSEVLVHGDFWPGNILWSENQINGVIDWEDAGKGDPCIDLAFARLEILWHFGKEMVNLFTNHYIHLCKTKGIELDLRSIAYWDLVAALRPCGVMQEWELPKEREQMMRLRHKEHVDTTLQTILNFEKI